MTFLPIVERELRVAARLRSTFWVRIAAALVAAVIGSAFLWLASASGIGAGGVNVGQILFGVLTWLSLAAALSAGLFFTSDCLSEEKREGTLGFLFLTDLRGYDVVLGKLLVTSLRGFYALLAVFPILAITLLLGGVTGEEFWKAILALINAMFVSLSAGMFVSALSREAQKAMGGTLVLLVLLIVVGPTADWMIAEGWNRPYDPIFSLSSPGFLFVSASRGNPSTFWSSLAANQAIAWLLLGLACVRIPKTWQDQGSRININSGSRACSLKYGRTKARERLRRKLIGLNPVLWLTCREGWQAAVFWILTVCNAVLVGGILLRSAQELWMLWSYAGGILTLVVYLGTASQASRFFVEARRTGLVELLLATPLTVQQIVQGQWRGMIRMFGIPLALYLSVNLTGAIVAQGEMAKMYGAATVATAPPAGTTNSTGTTMTTTSMTITTSVTSPTSQSVSLSPVYRLAMLAICLLATLTVVANLAALMWFGMWSGLNSNSPNLATLKTIVFVQVIPWMVISFASSLAIPLLMLPKLMSGTTVSNPGQMMMWYGLVSSAIATVLALAKDIGFCVWARRRLYSQFRVVAAQSIGSIQPLQPPLPPSSPSPGAPPVIRPG